MPYKLGKSGDKITVIKSEDGEVMGSHETRKEAQAQMAALYANEKKSISIPEGTPLALVEAASKNYDLEMAVYSRQMMQDEVGYDPLGATDTEGCANCNWFVSPNQCLLVCGDISPTGLSGMWKEKMHYEPEPMRVVVVKEEEKSIVQKAIDMLNSAINPGFVPTPTVPNALMEVKIQTPGSIQPHSVFIDAKSTEGMGLFPVDSSGQLRFVMWVSNKWRDRDIPPEILSDAAHKEYVAWVSESKQFPEAWLWHTPGTRWGQVDLVDYHEGFLIESGTVDPGKEEVAKALAADKNLGVSHGYFTVRRNSSDWSVVDKYRQYEISPLDATWAANKLTGVADWSTGKGIELEEIANEKEFAVNPQKRLFLVSKLGEDQVKAIENQTMNLAQIATKLGIETKDLFGEDGGGSGDPTNPPPAPPPPAPEATKEVVIPAATTPAAAPQIVTLDSKSMDAVVAAIKEVLDPEKLSSYLGGVEGRLKSLEEGVDVKVANLIRPPAANGAFVWNNRPSNSDANLNDGKSVPTAKESGQEDPSMMDDILAPIFGAQPKGQESNLPARMG